MFSIYETCSTRFIFTILTILTYMGSSNAVRSQVWISRCARTVEIYGRSCETFMEKAQLIHVIQLSSVSCKRVSPTFKDLVFDSAGPNGVYASFVEKGLPRSNSSTRCVGGSSANAYSLNSSICSEGTDRNSLIVFDEPETSLHPYAISVFADAVKHATKEWNKQVFIATHSPVLIGQFEPEDILATELDRSPVRQF